MYSRAFTHTDRQTQTILAVTKYLQHRERIKVEWNLKCVSLDRTRNSTQWKYCHGTLPGALARAHTRQLSATHCYIRRTDDKWVGAARRALVLVFHRVSAVSAQQSTTWVRFRSADLCLFIVILLHLLHPKRSFSLRSVTSFVVDVILEGGGGLH